jgi:signal transduction histidine kinase
MSDSSSRQAIPNPGDPGTDPSASAAHPVRDEGATGAARHKHFLHSLLELNRELSVTLDLYGTADLLLFNLMGQLGTARAAVWLLTAATPSRLVMVRCHGFERRALRAGVQASEAALLEQASHSTSPILSWKLAHHLGAAAFELMRQVDVALVAPLHGGDPLLGVLALGPRVDGRPYGADDLETLETALGMVSMSLQNSRLYHRVLENNRQLRTTNERLREHDRLKEQFLSNVNHELRTPLAVVQATFECLLDMSEPGERSRDLLAAGLHQTHHLRGLIENLLLLSDASQDRLDFELEDADVGPVLEGFAAERRAGMGESLREFIHEPADQPLVARFDRGRLVQILNELLDNAIKFTPAGAVIRLYARPIERQGATWIAITLADDGPGILPEHMSSVFRSFEQADGSSTRRVGGLGLGLTFARELATRMGCTLDVESQPGQGTTCTIGVPVPAN